LAAKKTAPPTAATLHTDTVIFGVFWFATIVIVGALTFFSSLGNNGLHSYSEVIYAFTSAAADNGSAFARLNSDTPSFKNAQGRAAGRKSAWWKSVAVQGDFSRIANGMVRVRRFSIMWLTALLRR